MGDFSRFTEEDRARLAEILGEAGLRCDPTALERYGRDETEDFHFLPEAVVLPASSAEVSAVLALARERRLPVTPRGAGTGLSGGALPVAGGLVLSVERLYRIREISVADQLAVAEVGVVTGELQRQVEELGLFYPPDPASRDSCLLAGNLGEDSAGPRSLKYGTTKAWVLGLEAVLPGGEVIHTGGRTRKNVAGYNLTQLLVGSEGTLAVITAATLRLTARPRATLSLLVPFPTLETA
nr:FAD-binding oxidoreductase [Thermoanaerobaculia bacterium]